MILIGLVAQSQEDPKKKGEVFPWMTLMTSWKYFKEQQKLIPSLLTEIILDIFLWSYIVYISLHWLKYLLANSGISVTILQQQRIVDQN